MQAELDRRIKEEEEERERGEEEAKERAVKDFELLQMGLEIRTRSERELNPRAIFGMGPPKVVGREGGKIILEEHEGDEGTTEEGAEEEGKRGKKRKFELDEEELMRLAREERQKAKIHINNEKVPSDSVLYITTFFIYIYTNIHPVSSLNPKTPLILGPQSHALRRRLRRAQKATKAQPRLPRL
jgi:nitric oxide synthase-interacting protein